MQNANPLNAVLVGTGMVSATYVDAIAGLDGVRLAGAAASSPESARRFAAQAAGKLGEAPVVFETAKQICADDTIDFVILATPPDARESFVRAFADAGLPIFMEKPVARTLDEAMALVAYCENRGVALGIALQHRVRPAAVALRQSAGAGALGALRAAEITVPWWRPQSYYDAPGRGTYARDGGGVMITQAIHTLDLALQFTGPVTHVRALTATAAHRMEAEDFVSAGLRFANGAVGNLLATTAAFPGRTEAIRLHHDRASVLLDGNRLQIDRHDGHSETHGAGSASGAGADPMAFTSDWHATLIADFADAVRTRGTPMVTGRSALEVHRVIEAVERAARSGCEEEVRTG